MIYKNCDGKKIDKCKDCKFIYFSVMRVFWDDSKEIDECKKNGYKFIPNKYDIPLWCPLEDYNEKR